MNYYEKILSLYIKNRDPAASFDFTRDNLLVFFLLLSNVGFFLFSIVTIINQTYFQFTINISSLFVLLAITAFLRFSGNIQLTIILFLIVASIATAFQHLISSCHIIGNLLWLPLLIVISSYLLTKKTSLFLAIFTFLCFLTVKIMHPIYHHPSEGFHLDAHAITDIMIISLASLFSFLLAKLVFREEKRAKEKLHLSRNKLEKINEDTKALAALLTHDISNPLMVGKLSLKKMVEKNEVKEDNPYYSKLKESILSIENIIMDARHLKSVAGGKTKVDLSPVSLRLAVSNALEQSRTAMKEKRVIFNTNMGESNEKFIILANEPSLTNSVVGNILTNAVKFSDFGGSIEIEIVKLEQSGQTKLTIRDHGIGIPRNILHALFSFETPTTRTGTAGEKGTGFGLPLVNMFVELYSARMEIHSNTAIEDKENHGTTVTIFFQTA